MQGTMAQLQEKGLGLTCGLVAKALCWEVGEM